MTGIFDCDGRPVDYETFRNAAIDPAASVVVDACAGSGKTTLLVSRIVRALLEGAEPDQILAVTFTRLAAHEMRQRLTHELRSMAMADAPSLAARLVGWLGLPEPRAAALADRARGLYESVLRHPRGPEITTFHRWFWRMARMAPVSSEAGEGSQLSEETAALVQQAWFGWLDGLRDPQRAALRGDFETLVAELGLSNARRCLESLLQQRTDWAIAHDVHPDAAPDALLAAAERAGRAYRDQWRRAARLLALEAGAQVSAVDDPDALGDAFAASPLLATELGFFERLLRRGSPSAVGVADRIVALLSPGPLPATAWLRALADILLTKEGKARKLPASAALRSAIAASGGDEAVAARWEALAATAAAALEFVDEWQGVELNRLMMRCAADLLGRFQHTKRMQGLLDFSDLESIAYRMLRDPATAAYIQARLDCRYRHLLFDEFQDTSSLQWRVIADWLQSYAGAGDRPSVFIVGDPKQSIYRFRRAEARVFDAAKELLAEGFAARRVATDTTRRNAPAIVDVLNRCLLDAMPHYRLQATLAGPGPGLFWRLPLIVHATDPAAGDDAAPADPFDWLNTPRDDEESLRYLEGLRIAEAIEAARRELASQGAPVEYRSVYVLVRSRSSFAAYERALRSRGLPVQSDRSGGLLATLEGDDVRALLAFMRDTRDDLALVQVLRSPLFGIDERLLAALAAAGDDADSDADDGPGIDGGAGDEAAGDDEAAASDDATVQADDGASAAVRRPSPDAAVAGTSGGHRRRWWKRLCAADDPVLRDAAQRLRRWLRAARRLPVHDFLDAVLSESDAFARYPAVVEPAQRQVVHANLCAMLGLALDVDGGRYPSLARFLHRLRGFDTLEDREGPSEGRSDTVDAVRLMTIHASKGLEADLVVLADAHHGERPEGHRLHVDWPPRDERPAELSFWLGGDLAGRSRAASFDREASLRQLENWNLLYVALTRGRRGVIVSGVQTRRPPEHSWYTVLQSAPVPPGWSDEPVAVVPGAERPEAEAAAFDLKLLQLVPLDVGERRVQSGGDASPVATELGHALHRALELLTADCSGDEVRAALEAFALDARQQASAVATARKVLAIPELAPAFAADAPACNELEILDGDGRSRRIDRLVRVGGSIWVLDYKWSVDARRRPEYVEQLNQYRALVEQLDPPPFGARGPIRTVLIDASAARVEFDPT